MITENQQHLHRFDSVSHTVRLVPEIGGLVDLSRANRLHFASLRDLATAELDRTARRIQSMNPWRYNVLPGEKSPQDDFSYYRDVIDPKITNANGAILSLKDADGTLIDVGYSIFIDAHKVPQAGSAHNYLAETSGKLAGDLPSIKSYLASLFPTGECRINPETSGVYHLWDYSTVANIDSRHTSDPLLAPFVDNARKKGIGRSVLNLGLKTTAQTNDLVVGFILMESDSLDTIVPLTRSGFIIGRKFPTPYADCQYEGHDHSYLVFNREIYLQWLEFTGRVVYNPNAQIMVPKEFTRLLSESLDDPQSPSVIAYNRESGFIEVANTRRS